MLDGPDEGVPVDADEGGGGEKGDKCFGVSDGAEEFVPLLAYEENDGEKDDGPGDSVGEYFGRGNSGVVEEAVVIVGEGFEVKGGDSPEDVGEESEEYAESGRLCVG